MNFSETLDTLNNASACGLEVLESHAETEEAERDE